MKLLGKVEDGTSNELSNFGSDPWPWQRFPLSECTLREKVCALRVLLVYLFIHLFIYFCHTLACITDLHTGKSSCAPDGQFAPAIVSVSGEPSRKRKQEWPGSSEASQDEMLAEFHHFWSSCSGSQRSKDWRSIGSFQICYFLFPLAHRHSPKRDKPASPADSTQPVLLLCRLNLPHQPIQLLIVVRPIPSHKPIQPAWLPLLIWLSILCLLTRPRLTHLPIHFSLLLCLLLLSP